MSDSYWIFSIVLVRTVFTYKYLSILIFSLALSACTVNPPPSGSSDIGLVDKDKLKLTSAGSSIPGAMDTGTVDLATGKVSFKVPLANLPGRNGLAFNLSANYSSTGIESIVNTWNLDAPTGAMGLGWSLPEDRIIRDIKGTGTPEDDTFSLVFGGEITELVMVNADDGGDQVFQTKGTFHNWDIRYKASTEQWTVITEDGMKHIYGGGVTRDANGQPEFYPAADCQKNNNKCNFPVSSGNSVEWMVVWGNWVGPSANVSKQGNLAVGWNLSGMQNIWGESTSFEYKQISEFVGGVGENRKKYTQESYLEKVTNADGQSLILNYAQKQSNEYQDPHTHAGGDQDSLSLTGLMKAPNWDDGPFGGKADPSLEMWIYDTNEPQKQLAHYSLAKNDTDILSWNIAPFKVSEILSKVKVEVKIYDKDIFSADDLMIDYDQIINIDQNRITKIPEVTQKRPDGTVHMNLSIEHNHLVSEPDAYQERYETQYLSSIQFKNSDAVLLSEVDLSYQLLGSLPKFQKRTLQSITHKIRESASNATLLAGSPSQKFSYWGQQTTDGVTGVTESGGSYVYDIFKGNALYGVLKTVTLPEGGTHTYQYAKNAIASASRQSPAIVAPSTSYNSVKSFSGPGFNMFTWHDAQANTLALQIWMWDGKWICEDFTLSNVSTASYAALDIASGDKFFVLLTPYKNASDNSASSVNAFYFDPLKKTWNHNAIDIKLTGEFDLSAGTNFFAFIDHTNGYLYAYELLAGSVNPYSFKPVSQGVHLPYSSNAKYALTIGPNYIFSYVDFSDNSQKAQARIDYRNSSGVWKEQVKTGIDNLAKAKQGIVSGLVKASALTGDNFVVVQGYWYDDFSKIGPPPRRQEYYPYKIFTLPPNLSDFGKNVIIQTYQESLLTSTPDPSTYTHDGGVFVTNDTIYFSATSNSTNNKTKSYHFNGNSWISNEYDNYYHNGLFTNNLMPIALKDNPWFGDITLKSSFRFYDPNSETVDAEFAPGTQVLEKAWKKYVHYLLEAATYITMVIPGFQEVGWQFVVLDLALNASDMGFEIYRAKTLKQADLSGGSINSSFLFSGSEVFFRNHDDTWSSIGVLDGAAKTKPAISSDYLAYKGTDNELYVQLLKNGKLMGAKLQLQGQTGFGATDKDLGERPDVLVSRDKDSYIYLYKVLQDDVSGKVNNYVVSSTTVNDGYHSVSMNYAYESSTARLNPSGALATYQKVTVTPRESTHPDGYTEHYFLNGDISTNSTHISADTVTLSANQGSSSNQTYNNLSRVNKLPYYSAVYDSSGTQVASAANFYEVYEHSFNGTTSYDRAYQIREVKTVSTLDGTETVTETEYDALGRTTKTYKTNYAPNGDTEVIETAITYATDNSADGTTTYPGLKTAHMLDVAIQEITTLYVGQGISPQAPGTNKTEISNSVSTWKNWGSTTTPKWGQQATYTALNNNPGAFNFVSTGGGSPAIVNNWLKTSLITQIDTENGIVAEVQNANAIFISTIYDKKYRFPVAQFTHASVQDEIAGYYGFESYENIDTWPLPQGQIGPIAHTGVKGLNGENILIATRLKPPSREVVVSAWVKPEPGGTCKVELRGEKYLKPVQTSDSSAWQYLELFGGIPETDSVPQASCTNGAIDDFRFGPVDAPFTATVYDDMFYQPTARMDTNGAVVRMQYDSHHRLAQTTGPEPGNQTNFSYYFSRDGSHNNDTFVGTDPNWTQINHGQTASRQSRVYNDGLGRHIQYQSLKGANNIITSARIYDGWGKPAIKTKAAEKTASLTYISDFASLDWTTGIMTGEVATYYQTGAGASSASGDDYKYPYHRVIYENNPLVRISQVAMPGAEFRYKATNDYTKHQDYGVTNARVNANNVEQDLFTLSGIPWDASHQQQYFGNKSSKAINNTQRRDKVNLKNLHGNLLAEQSGNTQLSIRNSFIYTHDLNDGSLTTKHYPPNAHIADNKRTETYLSTTKVDYRGHPIEKITPDSGTSQSRYDSLGRLRFLVDAQGASQTPNQVKYWKYDELNRVIEAGYFEQEWSTITYAELENAGYPSTPATWRVKYSYDMGANDDIHNLKGRLVQVQTNNDNDNDNEAEVIKTFVYNRAGQILQDSLLVKDYDSTTRKTQYAYNPFNELQKITYPSLAFQEIDLTQQNSLLSGNENYVGTAIQFGPGYGVAKGAGTQYGVSQNTVTQQLSYGYDSLGRVEKIGTPSDDDRYASYSYNADGKLATETTNSAHTPHTKSYHYNFLGQLTFAEELIGTDLYFSEILDYKKANNYQDGNIQKASYVLGTTLGAIGATDYSVEYSYDALGRLTNADNSINTDDLVVNQYDNNGNIKELTRGAASKINYSYYASTNKVQNLDGSGDDYQYNLDGSTIGTPALSTLEYDPFTGMTSSITSAQGGKTSFQYQNGTQRVLKTSGGSTLYLHGNMRQPLLELGHEPMLYIYGPTGLLAMNDGTTDYFVSKDHLGSTRAVRDKDNRVQAYFSYLPFGGEAQKHGETVAFRYRYTGQEFDEETGLYNYRARLYDTGLGRFYEVDPANEYSTPYAYVANNPIDYSDPSGEVKLILTWERVTIREGAKFATKFLPKIEIAYANDTFHDLMEARKTQNTQVEIVRRFDSPQPTVRADVAAAIAKARAAGGGEWADFKDVFRPGGMHEMLPVSMVGEAHEAGFTIEDIQKWTIPTDETFFLKRLPKSKLPSGKLTARQNFGRTKFGHETHKSESAFAHQELYDIIDRYRTHQRARVMAEMKRWQLGTYPGQQYMLHPDSHWWLPTQYQ